MIITSYATLNTGHPTLQKELDVLCNVHGITHRMYNNETIKLLPQYNDYKHILERPATKGMERARNAGYWIWKAMLILDALQYDDDVLYLDASIRFVQTYIRATVYSWYGEGKKCRILDMESYANTGRTAIRRRCPLFRRLNSFCSQSNV